jgi:NADH dehydrogenase [ubiquinone] 1 alpha subcomplex assembly factor 5
MALHAAQRGGKANAKIARRMAGICTEGLVAMKPFLHKGLMHDIEIFSRAARRRARDRMARSNASDQWLLQRMAADIVDRLDLLRFQPSRALLIGTGGQAWIIPALHARNIQWFSCDSGFLLAKGSGGVQCDEDRLPFADNSVDLIIVCGGLDTVNDLPGALVLMRRILKPGGHLTFALIGAPSLAMLRSQLTLAASRCDSPGRAHFHPQVDLRGLGGLLTRAGFIEPVVDADTVTARYSSVKRCITDLRATALTNTLAARTTLPRRVWLEAAHELDGSAPFDEIFTLFFASAWVPKTDDKIPSGPVTGLF